MNLTSTDDGGSTLRGRRVAVLVPCLNERETVTSVVRDFATALPHATVYVYDNGSTDGTGAAARMAGAEVRTVPTPGKGHVVRQMFRDIEADAYILVDGDDTYHAESAPEMLEMLFKGGLDMVSACRERRPNAYTRTRRLGNDLFSEMATAALGEPVGDLLTGYRALSRRFAKAFPAQSDGFDVETEMTFYAATQKMRTAEIQTPYRSRPEGSNSKLRTLRDGSRICRRLLSMTLARHPARVLRRHLTRVVLGAALTAAACTCLFLGLNWIWERSDPQPMLQAVEESYAYEPTSIETSFEKFNDCLIPVMATLRRESSWQSIVTAERVYRRTRPQEPCVALEQLVSGALEDEYIRHPYHQYWIGQRLFVQLLIPHLTVGGLRRSLLAVNLSLLAGGLLFCLWLGLRNAPDDDRLPSWRIVSYALVFASLLLFYGSIRQGASFTSAWPNALLYLALIGSIQFPLGRFRTGVRVSVVAAFGAAQAYFALMFGTIGLGLAVVLLIAALDPRRGRYKRHGASLTLDDREPEGLSALILEVTVAYVTGALLTLLLHVAIADLAYPQNVVRGFFDMLAYRVSGSPRTTMAPELQQLFTNNDPSFARMVQRMDTRMPLLGFGSAWGGRLLVGASLLVLIASAIRLFRWMGTLPHRSRVFGVLLSGWVVPVWYVVFLEHTQTHVRVMVRLWAWPIACTGVLLLLLVLGPRRTESSDEQWLDAPAEDPESPYL